METTTLMLGIVILTISIALNVASTTISIINKRKIKEISRKYHIELAVYDDQNKRLKSEINIIIDENIGLKFKTDDLIKLINEDDKDRQEEDKILKDKLFKLESELELQNNTEKNLQSYINKFDKEMLEQRERFEKLHATRYGKKDVLLYVNQAFKAGCSKTNKLSEYMKDFKDNL